MWYLRGNTIGLYSGIRVYARNTIIDISFAASSYTLHLNNEEIICIRISFNIMIPSRAMTYVIIT